MVCTVLVFIGCSKQNPTELTATDSVELWIVTEDISPVSYTSVAMIKEVKNKFQEIHQEVSLRIDILPTDESEREVYLERLRVEMLAGNGPDIYLMPTALAHDVEMLIPDVNLAMNNGMFADISTYYDTDEKLETQDLHQDVMDAGVVDGTRYVLPLRFNMPVLFADTAVLAENQISIDSISNILGLLEIMTDIGKTAWTSVLHPSIALNTHFETDSIEPYNCIGLSYLGQVMDYKSGTVNLSTDELARFIKAYGELYSQFDYEQSYIATSVSGYSWGFSVLGENGPVYLGSLSSVPVMQAIANAEGRDLTIVPMESTAGETVANVTFYGAVGASCNQPELAYEFLREFLTQEIQWNKVTNKRPGSTLQSGNWPMPGFTVRTRDCIGKYWDLTKKSDTYSQSGEEIVRDRGKITGQSFTNEDFAILDTNIDHVRFQNPIEVDIVGNLFYNLQLEPLVEEACIEEAEKIIQELQWHLAEG